MRAATEGNESHYAMSYPVCGSGYQAVFSLAGMGNALCYDWGISLSLGFLPDIRVR